VPAVGRPGSWQLVLPLFGINVLGQSERMRRGGYPSQAAARRARHDWLAATEADRTATGWTLERWLRHWLETRTAIRPTTRFHYSRDVEKVLIPHLGHYRLAQLDARLLRNVFAQIAATPNSRGEPQSPSAVQHLRTTLRAAPNLAVREGLIAYNPARHIEVNCHQQPHARVWTDARVQQWQQTGERPAVAVWTADHLATFLASVADDSLFAFWWLAALSGLRRGEMCGLRWSDLDLDRGVLMIERSRTTAGYDIVEGPPKTEAGRRAVALDTRTVKILRAHRRHQLDQQLRRTETGDNWVDSGYVFTRGDGLPINPNYATTRFRILIQRAGLPPVRLHDLRHGAASLAHQAGADLKTVQDLLGHSSIVITADTYTSVLPDIQRRCADATADLVLAAAHRTRKKIKPVLARTDPAGAHTLVLPPRPAPPPRQTSSSEPRSIHEWGPKPGAPTSHSRDTHHRTKQDGQQYPLVIAARPKGLEPLTF
jgi:integrase